MKMIRFLVLLLIVAVPSIVQAQQVVREYSTTIRIDVDAHGQVVDTGAPTHVPDVLAGAVRKTVLKWRFKPGQWQGHAVSIRTWIHAMVEVVKRSDKSYGVHVVYQKNGPKVAMSAPYSPPMPVLRQALRGRDYVDLLMAFQVDTDGTVSQIRAVNSNSSEARLVKYVRKSMEHWHASPMLMNGKPAISHMHIHISYSIDTRRPPPIHQQDQHGPAWKKSFPDTPVAVDSPLQAPIDVNSSI